MLFIKEAKPILNIGNKIQWDSILLFITFVISFWHFPFTCYFVILPDCISRHGVCFCEFLFISLCNYGQIGLHLLLYSSLFLISADNYSLFEIAAFFILRFKILRDLGSNCKEGIRECPWSLLPASDGACLGQTTIGTFSKEDGDDFKEQ